MNHELFTNMQKQMNPSPEVRAELSEKLAQPAKKRPVPWMKYGAVAACAALVIGAFTIYGYSQDSGKWMIFVSNFQHDVVDLPMHSYVTVEGMTGYVAESTAAVTGGEGSEEHYMTNVLDRTDSSGGDRDMGMAPEDLEQAMLDVGYTLEEIEEYQSIGYQMTWANWWKFVHQQENSEGADPFNLEGLKLFSQKELYVNTGALPGGAYIGDAPTQEEAVNAYEKLMGRFNGQYPDWYGGAYIDNTGTLIVQLVEDKDPGDKTLELQVLDWTDDGRVAFSSCKYSLRYLRDLQDKVVDAMSELDLFSSCGANEKRNRLDLKLTSVTDEALALLAELDPDDDAIYVQVGQRAAADVGRDVREPAIIGEDPAVRHVMPGGTPVPDDEDLIADEPYYDGAHYDLEELPEKKLPQEEMRPATTVDSAPEEDVSTSCQFPQE